MNRVQFLIVTCLSGVVALFIIVQLFLSWSLGSHTRDLRQASAVIQEGEADAQRLQQIATRVAQLSQNDEQMKDLLTRNNIQINNNTNTPPAAPAPAAH